MPASAPAWYHVPARKDPDLDWRLSWRLRDGKEEEYVISDFGAVMRGFNEKAAEHWQVLEWIKVDTVAKR